LSEKYMTVLPDFLPGLFVVVVVAALKKRER
jgi:hypothetical protein